MNREAVIDEQERGNRAPVTLPAGRRDVGSLLREYWVLLVLAAAAVAIPLVARHTIFPAYSWNRDEPVYLWQAHALRAGYFAPPDGGAPAFFRPWLSAATHGRLFSQYTLGWPLVLAASQAVLGSPDAALALGAVLVVLGTYTFAREITRDHVLALVAAGVMTLSPILAIQGGVYLGYLFTLGLGLLFGAALLSGLRRAKPLRIVAAGLMLGWIFMTRPYDALLWGLAVVGYAVFSRWGDWRRLARGAGFLALGVLPLFIATLAYNHRVTGSFTKFPITVADPLDKFGFGARRIMPTFGTADYGVGKVVKSAAKNAFYLPLFLVGGYLGLVVAAVGLWFRRRDRSTIALLALGAVFPLGYALFWGIYVSSATVNLSGPIYYVPLYAPLSILIAAAIVALWRQRRAAGIALVAVLAVATVPFAVSRISVNRRISETQIPWKTSTKAISNRALVFVWNDGPGPYLLYLNPFSANSPKLDDRVLYAVDRGPDDLDLIASKPGRTPYLQMTSVPPDYLLPNGHPRTPTVWLTRMQVLRGNAVSLRVHVENPGGSKSVVVYLRVGDHFEWRTLSTNSSAGASYDTSWTVAPPGTATQGGSVVPLTGRLGTLTIGVGYGPDPTAAARKPAVRQYIPYRVAGSSIEMLMPSRKVRAKAVKPFKKGKRKWFEELSLRELDVQPTPVTPR